MMSTSVASQTLPSFDEQWLEPKRLRDLARKWNSAALLSAPGRLSFEPIDLRRLVGPLL